ncbi:MAG: adenylosuccinate lyase [Tissierellia bacterium]|nr:adenylosuccinate lyase [Tissierellia bacterium]
MIDYQRYNNPLNTRYASREMSYLFSEEKKFQTYRKLWLALAKGEKKLGLPITEEQILELEENIENIDFKRAEEIESLVRHDVMAHVKAYGELTPKAAGIIHLGATSCYVTDNTDLLIMREGLDLLLSKFPTLIKQLRDFAWEYRDLPTLGYTHYQPAQPVTLGKRACLWLQDLIYDYEELKYRRNKLRLRGVKGTTGTQASFMELFNGNEEKVKELDQIVCKEMGFETSYPITGQTYSRKIDTLILQALGGVGQSLHKMTNDLRIMQHLKEVEEPFEEFQIGSSAMAYKRNPMRSERISSLSKYVISLANNPVWVHSTQWLERTLDDSANRRLSIGEGFLTTDALLEIAINVTSGLVVYPHRIQKHLKEELPFMATENILMEEVKRGGNRQVLHERIRKHSQETARAVKEKGKRNDLISRIGEDENFTLTKEELVKLVDAQKFIGRASSQVQEFLEDIVDPILEDKRTDYTSTLNV